MNVLVVGPHPDDQELGMGGAVARLAAQGHRVLLLDMTDGCPTPVGDRPTRLSEALEAARLLSPGRGEQGVEEISGGPAAPGDARSDGHDAGQVFAVRRLLLDLPNRRVEHSLHARHLVAGVMRAHRADVVFLPHPEDAHPDHLAVTRIVEDARFDAKLTGLRIPVPPPAPVMGYASLVEVAEASGAWAGSSGAGFDEGSLAPRYPARLIYYYCSHLKNVPSPSFVFDTSGYAGAKRRAIEAYRTQFEMHAPNRGVPQRIATQDAYFGTRIGAESGEAFWVREPLAVRGLEQVG